MYMKVINFICFLSLHDVLLISKIVCSTPTVILLLTVIPLAIANAGTPRCLYCILHSTKSLNASLMFFHSLSLFSISLSQQAWCDHWQAWRNAVVKACTPCCLYCMLQYEEPQRIAHVFSLPFSFFLSLSRQAQCDHWQAWLYFTQTVIFLPAMDTLN